MSDAHKNYLFDLGYKLKQDALEALQERNAAPEKSEDRAFKSGRLLALYAVISTMRNQAESFGIPLSDIQLDDIEPDRDLT